MAKMKLVCGHCNLSYTGREESVIEAQARANREVGRICAVNGSGHYWAVVESEGVERQGLVTDKEFDRALSELSQKMTAKTMARCLRCNEPKTEFLVSAQKCGAKPCSDILDSPLPHLWSDEGTGQLANPKDLPPHNKWKQYADDAAKAAGIELVDVYETDSTDNDTMVNCVFDTGKGNVHQRILFSGQLLSCRRSAIVDKISHNAFNHAALAAVGESHKTTNKTPEPSRVECPRLCGRNRPAIYPYCTEEPCEWCGYPGLKSLPNTCRHTELIPSTKDITTYLCTSCDARFASVRGNSVQRLIRGPDDISAAIIDIHCVETLRGKEWRDKLIMAIWKSVEGGDFMAFDVQSERFHPLRPLNEAAQPPNGGYGWK